MATEDNSPAWRPQVGASVDARYTLEEHLGDGPTGATFLARDERLEAAVVVHWLHPALVGEDFAADNTLRLQRARAFVHPDVARLEDVVIRDDTAYVVRTPAVGQRLDAWLAEHGRPDTATVRGWVSEIVSALEWIHRIGVHGNLRPSNVFVGDEGVTLTDPWYLERPTSLGALPAREPRWLAPEQRGSHWTEHAAADVHALGLLLGLLVAGRPVEGGLALSGQGVVAPAAIDAVFEHATQHHPDERYPDVAAFQAALETATSGLELPLPLASDVVAEVEDSLEFEADRTLELSPEEVAALGISELVRADPVEFVDRDPTLVDFEIDLSAEDIALAVPDLAGVGLIVPELDALVLDEESEGSASGVGEEVAEADVLEIVDVDDAAVLSVDDFDSVDGIADVEMGDVVDIVDIVDIADGDDVLEVIAVRELEPGAAPPDLVAEGARVDAGEFDAGIEIECLDPAIAVDATDALAALAIEALAEPLDVSDTARQAVLPPPPDEPQLSAPPELEPDLAPEPEPVASEPLVAPPPLSEDDRATMLVPILTQATEEIAARDRGGVGRLSGSTPVMQSQEVAAAAEVARGLQKEIRRPEAEVAPVPASAPVTPARTEIAAVPASLGHVMPPAPDEDARSGTGVAVILVLAALAAAVAAVVVITGKQQVPRQRLAGERIGGAPDATLVLDTATPPQLDVPRPTGIRVGPKGAGLDAVVVGGPHAAQDASLAVADVAVPVVADTGPSPAQAQDVRASFLADGDAPNGASGQLAGAELALVGGQEPRPGAVPDVSGASEPDSAGGPEDAGPSADAAEAEPDLTEPEDEESASDEDESATEQDDEDATSPAPAEFVPVDPSNLKCPAGMSKRKYKRKVTLADGSVVKDWHVYCIERYEYPGGGRAPRVGVSLGAAKAACRMRRRQLCSRREWRRACGGKYPYGRTYDPARCNTVGSDGMPRPKVASGSKKRCRGGGLYDMVGNVAEWSSEGYVNGGSAYKDGASATCFRSSKRSGGSPYVGFRCCADPKPKEAEEAKEPTAAPAADASP